MTPEQAQEIVRTSTRCTQAVLRAFNIEGYPYTGSGCLEYLTKNGYSIMPVIGIKTIKECINKFPSGVSLIILTKGHVIAIINGILVDTASVRSSTKVKYIWLVQPKNKSTT